MQTPILGNDGPPAGDPPADPNPNPSAGAGDAKVFTQADIDQAAGAARASERAKYSDYDTLKQRAQKADELEAANMTTLERAQADKLKAEREAIDARTQVVDSQVRSEIRVQAAQLGIDADAAYAMVDRSNISYTEEAGVSGVTDALKQLVDDKPFLKGARTPAPNLNPNGGDPPPAAVSLTAEQKQAASVMGISEENYAKSLEKPSAS